MAAVFLSASVPLPDRPGYDTSDNDLIKEAVFALLEVVLGKKEIIWGGQPAITKMIVEIASRYNVEYTSSVTLYQSRFFDKNLPEENRHIPNIKMIDAVENNREKSLKKMRKEMFEKNEYEAAVFIGGMEGINMEYQLFKAANPRAKIIAIPSPGGLAREVYFTEDPRPEALEYAINFTEWFYKLLNIKLSS